MDTEKIAAARELAQRLAAVGIDITVLDDRQLCVVFERVEISLRDAGIDAVADPNEVMRMTGDAIRAALALGV